VRATGAHNLVLVGGLNWGYDLSQLATYALRGTNIVYDTHPYPYGGKMPADWAASFGQISAKYALISAESGEYDCGTAYVSQLYSYLDALKIGWVAWAWYAQPAGSTNPVCGYPQLISNYQGKPTTASGQYIYQLLQSYIPAPVKPTPTPTRRKGSGPITVSMPTNPWSVQHIHPWKRTTTLPVVIPATTPVATSTPVPVVYPTSVQSTMPGKYNIFDKIEPSRFRKG
jgi:hypothetical protein